MKPHDDGRALDGALRRSLASRGAVVGNDCPDADDLAAYYEHSLDATETERLDAHFSDCARCREQLAVLVRSEPPRKDRAARHSWIWHWRWLAPVAAAATIVVLWAGIRARNTARIVAEPQIVAENRAPVNEPAAESAPAPAPRQNTIQRSQPTQATPTPEANALARPAPNLTTEAPGGREAQDEISRQAQEMRGAASGAPAARRTVPLPQAKAQAMRSPLRSRDVAPPPPLAKVLPSDNSAANTNATSAASQAAAAPQSSETVEVQSGGNAVSTTATSSPQPTPAQTTNPNGSTALEIESSASGKKEKQKSDGAHVHAAAGAAASGGVLGGVVSSATKTSASGPILITTPEGAIVWRILPGGGVEHSNDGGSTWQPQPGTPTEMWTSGSAPSEKVCWIVGRGGAAIRTTDAHTWKTVTSPTMQDLISVTAQSAKSATIAAADGTHYKTSNGGRTWKAARQP